MIDMAGQPTGRTTKPQLSGLTPTDLLRSNPCTSLIVVRAQVFRDVGVYDEKLRAVEDLEWPFRAAYGGAKFAGIDKVLASYRVSPGGLSADLDTMLKSYDQLLQAAARIAPELVKKNRRLAKATMLRYCARRAMEHSKGRRAAWTYLVQMLRAGPELFLHEPLTTTKVAALILLPDLSAWRLSPSQNMKAGEI